jgi:hypothetical protein
VATLFLNLVEKAQLLDDPRCSQRQNTREQRNGRVSKRSSVLRTRPLSLLGLGLRLRSRLGFRSRSRSHLTRPSFRSPCHGTCR